LCLLIETWTSQTVFKIPSYWNFGIIPSIPSILIYFSNSIDSTSLRYPSHLSKPTNPHSPKIPSCRKRRSKHSDNIHGINTALLLVQTAMAPIIPEDLILLVYYSSNKLTHYPLLRQTDLLYEFVQPRTGSLKLRWRWRSSFWKPIFRLRQPLCTLKSIIPVSPLQYWCQEQRN
jgi:hypothetical protein